MTPTVAIRAEGLGKRYRIGADGLGAWWSARRRAPDAHDARELWALRDVSFELGRGEVLGIVGHNGAGKSTLLKLLSRITEPSEGCATIAGRASSLLEVGTGFHPELTGRENVHLGGAVLGMKRAEIRERFDEIVEFSGVGRFLDTPVKRYSTGMRVRLAFAVAAHLRAEILIVDEVLAVGDNEFQKKCLGAMEGIAGEGRTVVFVSHNLSALRSLCPRSLHLDGGRLVADGPSDDVIERYVASGAARSTIALEDRRDRAGNGRARFVALQQRHPADGDPRTGSPFGLALRYQGEPPLKDLHVAVIWVDRYGSPLFTVDSQLQGGSFASPPEEGEFVCRIPRLPLAAGEYRVHLWAGVGGETADYVLDAGAFNVAPGDWYGTGRTTQAHKHGPVLVDHEWELQDPADAGADFHREDD